MRRCLHSLCAIVCGILSLNGLVHGDRYGGGSGTAGSPYQIWTEEQMNTIGAWYGDWGYHFILMADLDMSAYSGTQYRIIGNESNRFTGTFDGNRHVIRNLNYTSASPVEYVGLFGYVMEGTIKNLGIENASISCHDAEYAGILAGFLDPGFVEGCYTTGLIEVSCDDPELYVHIGGLAGRTLHGGQVALCYSTAQVTCVSSAASARAGGLIGDVSGSIVEHCYSRGAVTVSGTAWNVAGGLAGIQDKGVLSHCYSTGLVQASGGDGTAWGGLAGFGGDTVNSFWDVQTSGMNQSSGGCGRTTAQMKQSSNYVGWNTPTETYWTINEGVDYPRLAWENQPGESLGRQVLSDYVPGAGTPDAPYRIGTAEQLNRVGLFAEEWDKVFLLENDIDLAAYTGTEFNRIGVCESKAFTGVFNGKGHTVSNFTYATSAYVRYAGLFGYAKDATIRELGVEDAAVSTCGLAAGVLVGCQSGGSLESCHSTGTVSSTYAGGLTGLFLLGTMSDCFSSTDVSGSRLFISYAGGLAGINNGHVYRSFSSGEVTSTVTSVSSLTGAGAYAGGLAGSMNGAFFDCFSTGPVTCQAGLGTAYAGGVTGYQSNYNRIERSFAAGAITAGGSTVYRGGLVGYKTGTQSVLIGSFWDTTAGGTGDGVGNLNPDPSGALGRTTADMQQLATFTQAGWDFVGEAANGVNEYWRMCADGVDYPRLSRQFGAGGDFACPDGVAMEDLAALAQEWLTAEAANADFNYACDGSGDGLIDLVELAILSRAW